MAANRKAAVDLLKTFQNMGHVCPAHSTTCSSLNLAQPRPNSTAAPKKKEYAFEMNCASIRYGPGVTRELGMELVNIGAKKVCVVTDNNLVNLPPMKAALDSLHKENVPYEVYHNVRIEPTDESFKAAAEFAKKGGYDAFVAVGGGSVMDTCKAANLYACHPDADFLDFVNAPVGKGLSVPNPLKPLIALPTTCGTGSETTGSAIFDMKEQKFKTGISNRALVPRLALVDPLSTNSLPPRVIANSGYDVLCHALESFTALPYRERDRPANPRLRPSYQGRNPISDVWATHALTIIRRYFKRAIYNEDDIEARSQMHLASTYAGIGFGNAGVHLCHGLSYAISGMVKSYKCKDYNTPHPLVPHGLSVIITSPAVFEFTAPACPDRHLLAAKLLGQDILDVKQKDAGRVLAEVLKRIMQVTEVEDGLEAFGYTRADVYALAEKTLPQKRVTQLTPRQHTVDDLAAILERSLRVY